MRQLAGSDVVVHSCKFCAVPLNWVLDVDPAPTGPQLVSHEATRAAYALPGDGGKLRSTDNVQAAREGEALGHLDADQFSSIVLESSKPLLLSRFQDLLAHDCMKNVYRAKGNVFFAELPHHRYMFHWSGRQRFELSSEGTVGAASVQLVILGRDLSENDIRKQLDECSVDNGGVAVPPQLDDFRQRAESLVQSDVRFDVVHREDLPNLVMFRLTGHREFSITYAEAVTIHGINMDRMNREFFEAVNCSSGSALVASTMGQDGVTALCHPLGGRVTLDVIWPTVLKEAEKIIALFYHHVRSCKCGW